MLHREHGGTLGLREGAKLGRCVASPVNATTDFEAGLTQRVVLVEWDDVEHAAAVCHVCFVPVAEVAPRVAKRKAARRRLLNSKPMIVNQAAINASVPLLTDDSQIGANLRVCADEENRADFDQRG
jgi:hypothetical protein